MLLFGANLSTALEPIPKESGFSGFIRPGWIVCSRSILPSVLM
jgi:hypothetical protein